MQKVKFYNTATLQHCNSLKIMKVLIAAGGTGGHIYPGIAVAREIMRRDETSEVLFVGTSRGLETKIVPDNNFQLSLINSAGLKNVGFVGKLKGLFILPKSFLEARRLLKEFQPDVVIGAGGYVSGPVLLIASFQRIPTLVMDSNALPGFTNRRLAPFVTKAALTFEEAVKYAQQRRTFGKPISEHQAIQWMLADAAVEIEAARMLVYRAAWLKDVGKDFGKMAAMGKLKASEVAEKVCHNAVQIHGSYGYSREFPVERMYRDQRLMSIGEGTSEIQRMVIARHMLREMGGN